MTEIWKDIQGYEGLYQVSNLGRVKSLERITPHGHKWKEKVMKLGKDKDGYLQVHLYKNGRPKMFKTYRLVAEAFIPNPENLPCINHKDEVKINNFCGTPEKNYTDGNLEWCTNEYNLNYGTRNKRIGKSQSKLVLQLRKDGSLVRVWPSLSEVQRQLNYGTSCISKCCKGKRHSAHGFKWCYAEK